ncbi:mg2+ transporter [Fusarium austroafricanum]|uniref:Mg2+ transporter n=1 Tax=Fusarium austroafricanum TaxID=2364996 RepID=A0A8H4KAR8_9HYPO|nr:mg2+ transporter [Fusarium austroafricanum]
MRPWVNQVLVSDTVSLVHNKKESYRFYMGQGPNNASNAWVSPKSFLEDGKISTRLIEIHSADYYQERTGCQRITLNCPKRPPELRDELARIKMRWLHLEGNLSNLNGLELDTGTVLRYVGRHLGCPGEQDCDDTEPVIFLSTPFLSIPKTDHDHHCKRGLGTKTLLEFLYGSEARRVEETSFGRSTPGGRMIMSHILEIPEAVFLLVGASILISVSGLSWEQMLVSDIGINWEQFTTLPTAYTIHLSNPKRYVVVERDCSYEAFIKTASESSSNDDVDVSTFKLVDEHGHVIDHKTWCDYLASGEVEQHLFDLVRNCSAGAAQSSCESSPKQSGTSDENNAPFLTWPLTWNTEEKSVKDGNETLIQLLDTIDESLTNSPLGNFYTRVAPRTSKSVREICLILESTIEEDLSSPETQREFEGSLHSDTPGAYKPSQFELLRTLLKLPTIADDHGSWDNIITVNDPCLAWIQRQPMKDGLEEKVISVASKLIDTLIDIQANATEIHTFANGKETPILTSLVQSFESIVILYILVAQELSEMNRERLQNQKGFDTCIQILPIITETRFENINAGLKKHLENAMRNVMIPGRIRGDIDRLTITRIGLELLLATMIHNLHGNTIIQDTSRTLDIIKYYRTACAKLRYVAARDPKRQRFLEISALEEEMNALRVILEVQVRMIKTLDQVLSPGFFPRDTTRATYLRSRKAAYGLERQHFESDIKNLEEDIKMLEILQRLMHVTRHNMKQVIEVLDEGHGKAIRVFTFVTLFFLPL